MHLLLLVFQVSCVTTRLISAAPEVKPCDDKTYDETTEENLHVPVQGRIFSVYGLQETNVGTVAKLIITVDGKVESGCGGTLISPNYVLTFSSCIPDNKTVKTEIEVILGVRNLSHNEPYRITRTGKKIMRTEFNPDSDVALVRLSQPVEFNEHIKPTRLPAEGNWYKKHSGVVLDWRAEVLGKPGKGELQAVNVTFLNDCVCRQAYGNEYQKETMLCAGPYHDNSDSCAFQDDLGGPLYVGDFIVGIVSHHYCDTTSYPITSEKRHPRIYTKVSSYLRWIYAHADDEDIDISEELFSIEDK